MPRKANSAGGLSASARLAALAAVVVTLLATPATSLGVLRTTLTGSIDPAGTVEVKVGVGKLLGDKARKYSYELNDVPVSCEGGATTTASGAGSNTISNDDPDKRKFGTTTYSGNSRHPREAFAIKGRLVSRSKAKGTVRAWGSALPLPNGETADCESGTLHWVAKR